jgi:hypothetical protein
MESGFGSSPFDLVVTEWVDNRIQIVYEEEFERPDFALTMAVGYLLMEQIEQILPLFVP